VSGILEEWRSGEEEVYEINEVSEVTKSLPRKSLGSWLYLEYENGGDEKWKLLNLRILPKL
jgi:hypothetical protein